MKINADIDNNSVRADRQVSEKFKLFNENESGYKVLFLGNSITVHERAPQIGWDHNWGMAASREANDYVHLVLRGLGEGYGALNYCIADVGTWELKYWDGELLNSFSAARDFRPDLVIVRLGENVNRAMFGEYNFAGHFAAFLRYFHTPGSELVVTGLFWEHEETEQMIRREAEKEGGKFVVLSDLGYRNENKALGQYAHPGVALHPNDRGMRAIAERILAAVRA